LLLPIRQGRSAQLSISSAAAGKGLAGAKSQLGNDVVTHAVDITDKNAVKNLANGLGEVDHLITTAASLAFKPLLQLTDADIRRSLGAKFWRPIYLVRHLAEKVSKTGSVILTSGAAAYKAAPGGSIVAAANAVPDGLASTLARELAPVRVNVVSPGIFDSPTWSFLDGDKRKRTLEVSALRCRPGVSDPRTKWPNAGNHCACDLRNAWQHSRSRLEIPHRHGATRRRNAARDR
jgi:NAD(P)-dependent dehydrogenase (short-subunit alcohol dehydrogenase family)